jgi:hypothetical protein
VSRDDFFLWASLVTGVLWTATYVLIIVRGFQDRTYGMPAAAMCANICWEFYFGFVQPTPAPQVFVNRVWFLFDVVILAQYVRYRRTDYPPNLSPRWFAPMLGLMLAVTFGLVVLISREFDDPHGRYTAFGGNLLMSILFITMLLRRNSLAGQSLAIALCKMLGTAVVSVGFAVVEPPRLLLSFLSVAIFVFDLIYVVAVYRMRARPATDYAVAQRI